MIDLAVYLCRFPHSWTNQQIIYEWVCTYSQRVLWCCSVMWEIDRHTSSSTSLFFQPHSSHSRPSSPYLHLYKNNLLLLILILLSPSSIIQYSSSLFSSPTRPPSLSFSFRSRSLQSLSSLSLQPLEAPFISLFPSSLTSLSLSNAHLPSSPFSQHPSSPKLVCPIFCQLICFLPTWAW